MALRGSTLLPSTVTNTLVCIDGIKDFELAGKLFNPFMPKIMIFRSIIEFIEIMNDFFDEIGFPQASYAGRFFDEKKIWLLNLRRGRAKHGEVTRYSDDAAFDSLSGDVASFNLQVQSRYNATWQGFVEWRGKGQKRVFMSMLELIKLMDEAARESADDKTAPRW